MLANRNGHAVRSGRRNGGDIGIATTYVGGDTGSGGDIGIATTHVGGDTGSSGDIATTHVGGDSGSSGDSGSRGDICIAFPGGRGTANMVMQAKARGLRIITRQ